MYVFDLEGTLSNCKHRMHHYENKNWEEWNNQFAYDKIRFDILRLYNVCRTMGDVVILTSKEKRYENLVRHWLATAGINFKDLYMKKNNDKRTSPEFKLEVLKMLKEFNEIHLVFDDRRDVVDVLLENNIPSICVE